MKRVKYETLGDLLDQRKAEQEQPTGMSGELAQAIENHLSVMGAGAICDCRFHRALRFAAGDAHVDVNQSNRLHAALEECCPGVHERNRPAWATMNVPEPRPATMQPKMTQDEEDAAAAPSQTGAEIPPAVTDADIRAIQTIREAWNMVTNVEVENIKGYLGEGVSAYQFWLELHYARAEAELVQIKERYSTYRAAATAQAKLFAAQIELLKEQLRDNDLAFAHANELIGKYMKDADDLKEELAAARNKALEEAAKVCDWLGAEASNYEGSAEDYRNYTFTELWDHRAHGQFHCAKAIRALQTPSDQGAAKEGE